MNPSLDLNLLLLARQGGSDKAELPDLYAVMPPRRTAHGREADSLIIYLSMTGNSPLSSEAHAQLLEQVSRKFYKTTGSLTGALRVVTEALNLHLLDRNLHSTSVGRQGIGQLILVAQRADTLYLAHCGPVHAFLVNPNETQHLHDPQSSGRGLGLSQTTPIRFLQAKMQPGDFLVLATIVSPSWISSSLNHPQHHGVEGIRRQMLENASQEFNAVIIEAQAGTGKLRLLKRKTEGFAMDHPSIADQPLESVTPETSTPVPDAVAQPAEDRRLGIPSSPGPTEDIAWQPDEDRKLGVPTSTTAPPSFDTEEIRYSRGEQSVPVPLEAQPASLPPISFDAGTPLPDEARAEAVLATESTAQPAPPPARVRKARAASGPSRWSRSFASFRGILVPVGSAILRALRSALATISGALFRLLKNLLPDADVLRLPPSMMVFIALAIPLVLATIGGMVFLQRGRAQQSEIFYQKALDEAASATTLTDPLEQRLAWQNVLEDLDKAEYYAATSQSQALRTQAIENLDNLDAIKRLDYKQAIVGGLDSGVSVTRLIATATDLYILNGMQGDVLRAIMTGRGYEIDPNFQCGPTYGPINVGPLVDIAELPPGSFENASLLGMDANGNLLYCVIGSQPYSATMAPPNTGFGEPNAMTLDGSDLFVLDPKVNAVWIYRNLVVREQPRLFFGDFVPPMLDVIDLAVYNDDLFLLHADGHTTKCTYSGLAESPTRCDDPYPYSDNRPGRVHGPLIEDTVFNQIYFLSFPGRSIYLLDPQNQALYYFSVLLNLQWQYRPVEVVSEGKATAFAINPNRTAFLAIGNEVFYAAMP